MARLSEDMAVGEASAWRAVLVSRLVVWAAGVGAVVAWGVHDRNSVAFDPTGLTRPFGTLGDDLVAPAARWDTVWFEHIARDGYDAQRAAFFPLYPLLVRALGFVVRSDLVAGILLSLVCFGLALVLLERLVALDFGRDVARLTVWIVALFPAAVWFSAVYSEALF
ncbi:MAG TPA: mannosyltransferase family protein, partial [Casimicrobiaceae bacterium]